MWKVPSHTRGGEIEGKWKIQESGNGIMTGNIFRL